MTDKEWDERFLEMEKRMDLMITNQLIVTECLDKINKTVKELSVIFSPKVMDIPLRKHGH